jgi:adenylylsulfate kinase
MSWAIWITGLPGSGKTTIAVTVADALRERGVNARILDIGDVRAFVTAAPVSPLVEDVAHRALVYAAKCLSESGTPVIVDATAPAREWRELARRNIARFAEVELRCAASTCGSRERAVRWQLAEGCQRPASSTRADGPEIVLAYEHARAPELIIHTDVEDVSAAAQQVVRLALRLQHEKRVEVA